VEARERAQGPARVDLIQNLNDLGYVLRKTGDLATDRDALASCHEGGTRTLGPESHLTVSTAVNLGTALIKLGDFAGASPILSLALAAQEARLGPDDQSTLSLKSIYAMCLTAAGISRGRGGCSGSPWDRWTDCWDRTMPRRSTQRISWLP
jgi:hypothetical protein